jgi:hypothetical protein
MHPLRGDVRLMQISPNLKGNQDDGAAGMIHLPATTERAATFCARLLRAKRPDDAIRTAVYWRSATLHAIVAVKRPILKRIREVHVAMTA